MVYGLNSLNLNSVLDTLNSINYYFQLQNDWNDAIAAIDESSNEWINAEIVLFPININNNHWLFSAFLPLERKVIVCDSLRLYGNTCLEILKRFENQFNQKFDNNGYEAWTYHDISEQVPCQMDTYK